MLKRNAQFNTSQHTDLIHHLGWTQ